MKGLFVILLFFASCSAVNKKYKTESPHFFACNKWTDHNQDGIYDSYEFENIKSTFTSSEKVLFVGFFSHLPLGTRIRFRLFAPDGSLFDEFTQPQLYSGTLFRSEYSAGDLISGKSTGLWNGVWDIENEVVTVIEVRLIH